ncbi:DUF4129 domain-containing protein [Tessaracoccus sp. OS52]|uniref:DUF4129 domain-containing protein n=1 Tax=Tessaracoccus sp. OS52 TaxID=2886691 RepID=UPI001D100BEA|nr:DUF4129 domain-containing protein [Tessaracoccus sp. OS52]
MRDPGREAGRPPTRSVVVGLICAAVLVLAALGATSSWGPVVEVLPPPPTPVETGPLPTLEPEPTPSEPPGDGLPDILPMFQIPEWVGDLLRTLAVLAVAALVGWFVYRVVRALQSSELDRAGEASGSAVEIPDIDEDEVVQSLSDTIASLRSGMAVDDAVVECWHRLEGIAAETGIRRGPSQTSLEFTVEILGHAVVDGNALAELAALYRRALFSGHVLGDAERERAISCLERLAGDLDTSVGDLDTSPARSSQAPTRSAEGASQAPTRSAEETSEGGGGDDAR